jgi:hypothetical protein
MNSQFNKYFIFKQVQAYSMIKLDLRAPENFKL